MKKLRIHYLQHVFFEDLGCIETWALQKGHLLSATRLYEPAPFPHVESFDWLIVMGGPMGVQDDQAFPWLGAEKAFIKEAIQQNKVVIGICLGAQLIAHALGARVKKGKQKEIGWFPVWKTCQGEKADLLADLPDAFPVFHWHGDTFDIPEGAVQMFESAACKNQAFLYEERVLGLQFHFEVTEKAVHQMIQHGKNEISLVSAHVQSSDEMEKRIDVCEGNNKFMYSILDRLAAQENEKVYEQLIKWPE